MKFTLEIELDAECNYFSLEKKIRDASAAIMAPCALGYGTIGTVVKVGDRGNMVGKWEVSK